VLSYQNHQSGCLLDKLLKILPYLYRSCNQKFVRSQGHNLINPDIASNKESSEMKILFISGREPGYVRNAMILKGLQKSEAEILDCSDSSASYPARYVKVLVNLSLEKMILILFSSDFLVNPRSVIKKLTSKPIIFDAFYPPTIRCVLTGEGSAEFTGRKILLLARQVCL
jgi:hypothetical protein